MSPPTGFSTGAQNSELNGQLFVWNRAYGHGKVLDSSTGISIGLMLRPTLAGLAEPERLPSRQISETNSYRFLRNWSSTSLTSDTAGAMQRKVIEWISAGVAIVVLLDPGARTATTYSADGPGQPSTNKLT